MVARNGAQRYHSPSTLSTRSERAGSALLRALVTPLPPPSLPWQVTGNHWLSLPCIHPADGAVHAVGVLHRGARAAIEFAGGANFLDGSAPALLRPMIEADGRRLELAAGQMAWERAMGWLPTFTCTLG